MNPNAKKRKARHASHGASAANENFLGAWVGHLLRGFLCTLGIGAVLVLLASLAAYFTPDPMRWVTPMALLASALTALLGGMVTVRLHGHAALLCGLWHGGIWLTAVLLVSLCFGTYASGYPAWGSALLHAAVPICSVIGAYLGLRKAPKCKKRR